MKKTLFLLCGILFIAFMLTPLCSAEGGNYDTLADWNIKIAVPENTTAVLEENEYYIYARNEGSIPYVMVRAWRYDDPEAFLAEFTAYMQKQYPDLQVTADKQEKTVGDKHCLETDYTYRVSGYDVKDRRIVMTADGLTYMFASKEIEELGLTVGNMLEDVVAGSEILSPSAEAEEENGGGLADAYLYCLDSGMPKYWLDFSGTVSDQPVLHCFFRSGEPTFYETLYLLDMNTAEITENGLEIRNIRDQYGFDHSDRFRQMNFRFYLDGAVMTVERDERTLAGGEEDNILSGTYVMYPAGVGTNYEYRENGQLKYRLEVDEENLVLQGVFGSGAPETYERSFYLDIGSAEKEGDYTLVIRKVTSDTGDDVSYWFKKLTLTEVQGAVNMTVERDDRTLAGGPGDNILTGSYLLEPKSYPCPAEDGPYSAEELGKWAQFYYFRNYGYFPEEAETVVNGDGSVTVHLFEIVEVDGLSHTATSAWYTVDQYGTGTNDITGETVDLFRR